jgi:hypothetical protein
MLLRRQFVVSLGWEWSKSLAVINGDENPYFCHIIREVGLSPRRGPGNWRPRFGLRCAEYKSREQGFKWVLSCWSVQEYAYILRETSLFVYGKWFGRVYRGQHGSGQMMCKCQEKLGTRQRKVPMLLGRLLSYMAFVNWWEERFIVGRRSPWLQLLIHWIYVAPLCFNL